MRLSSEDKEFQKGRILESARTVFASKGYAGTKMEDIAAEAGISRTPLYNHYESKQLLFLTVLDMECSELERTETLIFLSDIDIFEKIYQALCNAAYKGRMIEPLRTQMYFASPDLAEARERFQLCHNYLIDIKRQAFQAALQQGELRSDCDIDFLIELIFYFHRGMQGELEMRLSEWNEPRLVGIIQQFVSMIKTRYAVL